MTLAEQKPVAGGNSGDAAFMLQALALAETGLGRTAPNPSVGCLVVRDGVVVGAARSADGGRPHAETRALAQAGELAQGATVYTTLEPCGHHGKTPPCVDALIRAGVVRVVIACLDPNQRGNGCVARLEAVGIEVAAGIAEAPAQALNEGFFKVIAAGRPLVTAKIATSLDGRIATAAGQSRWITGEAARRAVHEYRATHDAVLAGIGTVLADDPLLTVRLAGHDGRQPVRIVIDPGLKTPLSGKLVNSAVQGEIWLLCAEGENPPSRERLAGAGAKIITLPAKNRHFDPASLLETLAALGITRLMVEGGGRTLGGFLRAGLVDRLLWFRAPFVIGGDGVPAFAALGLEGLADCPRFTLEQRRDLGEDVLEIWRPKG